jgi:DNA-binding NtrC family response regulator
VAEGDGDTALHELSEALKEARRRLPVREAAALWNDLAMVRAQVDDLAGAERAAGHAARVMRTTEGPRRVTLALRNLAEARLRRGRLVGVREILEEALSQNRLDKNQRAAAEDAGLWARYEMVQGRWSAAVATARHALDEQDEAGLDWHVPELRVLCARALGWLGRAEEARQELRDVSPEALGMLESEEIPALWALAGERETALGAARKGPLRELWEEVLKAETPGDLLWRSAQRLEPFRLARLVWDAELLSPGAAPVWLRRQAAEVFRRLGAVVVGDRLVGREPLVFHALTRYSGGSGSLAELFQESGYGEVRLTLRSQDTEKTLVDGPGGAEKVVESVDGSSVILESPVVDAPLRALLAVALRDLGKAMTSPRGSLPRPTDSGILGEDRAFLKTLERADRLARGSVPIMILGESGTGKELVAKRIHNASSRAHRFFLPLNCAALSENLALSDLFGHVRGAFTGADRNRQGVFEMAQEGTVFLDEVGDLPAAAQGMLLRVLQEKELRRVGESVPRKVDVRVVVATHRDLEQMVANGAFRQDLYYRLKVGRLELPPLRDRGRDVLVLAESFLLALGANGRTPTLTPETREMLLSHSWPGNVRELKNVLEAAAALSDDGTIMPEHLDLPAGDPGADTSPGRYHEEVDRVRRSLIQEALEACSWNRSQAARQLGLSRQTLSYLARKFRLVPPPAGRKK